MLFFGLCQAEHLHQLIAPQFSVYLDEQLGSFSSRSLSIRTKIHLQIPIPAKETLAGLALVFGFFEGSDIHK